MIKSLHEVTIFLNKKLKKTLNIESERYYIELLIILFKQ
jgi:hypothetical protein